jgi:hypoxanthine phosphoribosyltransferase
MIEKKFIGAQELLESSMQLGVNIYESGYNPNFIIAIWRGGTPVGIAVQELLDYFKIQTDHISIRTSSYYGIGQRSRTIRVHGLDYIIKNINLEDRLLIVDDVFDTGLSINAVIAHIKTYARKNTPNMIRIATPYYKPNNNKTDITPDYYIYKTDKWLIFPHELNELSREEIKKNKPKVFELISSIK